jgi:hypothetical protein
MKSLYAYFGLLDLHEIDSPGHSLYQLGLIDSIACQFNQEKFDFLTYYPVEILPTRGSSKELIGFPEDSHHSKIFKEYFEMRIDEYLISAHRVFSNISNRTYDKLFLKARFRNLSTLGRKWRDARLFENLIQHAIEYGYGQEDIIILDTDLSLSKKFVEKYRGLVTIVIPSIDFPAISGSFLKDCYDANVENWEKKSKGLNTVYYGNVDTSKYKEGNQKNAILGQAIRRIEEMKDREDTLTLICKREDYSGAVINTALNIHIDRNDRIGIFNSLAMSNIMLNVTKDKYNDLEFIPARIYEAIIFGMIPVSYKFEFMHTAFSFNDLEDLEEIYLYLKDCSHQDMLTNYISFVNSFINAKPFSSSN